MQKSTSYFLASAMGAIAAGTTTHKVALWAQGDLKPAEPGCECRDSEGGVLLELTAELGHCEPTWNNFNQWCDATPANEEYCAEFMKRHKTDCKETIAKRAEEAAAAIAAEAVKAAEAEALKVAEAIEAAAEAEAKRIEDARVAEAAALAE